MGRSVYVRMLGTFQVELGGRTVPDEAWRRRRAAALVQLLALAPAHRLPREAVIDALWPDMDVAAAAANLRKAAHHARRTLGVNDLVVLDGAAVHLLPGARVETDVARFESDAREALLRGDPERCREVAALYGGDLLPGERYEAWSEGPREQLRALYRELLLAGRMWGRLLELDPASELAHREIIRERLEAGDRAGAIRQFDRLRTVLRDELGVSPDPDSLALYERVLAFEDRDVPTPAERARALLAWGVVHWERSDLAEAGRAAAEARALAIDAGLGRELADASELLSLIAYAQGRWREVFGSQFVETLERSPELAPFVFDANLCMSEFALHEADGLMAVADFSGQLCSVPKSPGATQAHAVGLLLRGEVELFEGSDLAAAAAHLGESLRLHGANSSATGVAIATERLAQAEWVRGDAASARRLHRKALARAVASPVSSHLLPLVYGGLLEAAEPAAALGLVAEAEASLAQTRPCAPCSMSFHLGATNVYAQHVAEHERARSHLEQAERIARMWRGGPWHAAVAETRAILRAAERADPAEIRAQIEGAAEGFATSGRLRDADRCRRALMRLA